MVLRLSIAFVFGAIALYLGMLSCLAQTGSIQQKGSSFTQRVSSRNSSRLPPGAVTYIPSASGGFIYKIFLNRRKSVLVIQRVSRTDVHEFPRGKQLGKVKSLEGKFAPTPDGRFLIGSKLGYSRLQKVDIITGRSTPSVKSGGRNWIVICSPTMEYVACASQVNTVDLVNLKNGFVKQLVGVRGNMWCMALSRDGQFVTFGLDNSGIIIVWNSKTGRAYRDFSDHELLAGDRFLGTNAVDLSHNGDFLMAATTAGTYLWHVPSSQLVSKAWQFRSGYSTLSTDGRRLAGKVDNNRLIINDDATGRRTVHVIRRTGIEILETATGGRIAYIPSTPFQYLLPYSFSDDGRYLCSVADKRNVIVWDLLKLEDLDTKDDPRFVATDEKLWSALKHENSRIAYQAIRRLVEHPDKGLRLLRQRLKPVPKQKAIVVGKLIEQLGDVKKSVREKAKKQLKQMGSPIRPLLQQVQENHRLKIVRDTATELLGTLPYQKPTSEEIRQIRAVQVLQWIGGQNSEKLLAELAGGDPVMRQSQEAKTALRLLNN